MSYLCTKCKKQMVSWSSFRRWNVWYNTPILKNWCEKLRQLKLTYFMYQVIYEKYQHQLSQVVYFILSLCSFHLCLIRVYSLSFSTHNLGTAYGKTLRRYHGWVVRGVFAVSVWFPLIFFRLFICSFVRSFVRACVRAFRSFVWSFVLSPIRSGFRLFVRTFVCSFVRSCARLSWARLFVRS